MVLAASDSDVPETKWPASMLKVPEFNEIRPSSETFERLNAPVEFKSKLPDPDQAASKELMPAVAISKMAPFERAKEVVFVTTPDMRNLTVWMSMGPPSTLDASTTVPVSPVMPLPTTMPVMPTTPPPVMFPMSLAGVPLLVELNHKVVPPVPSLNGVAVSAKSAGMSPAAATRVRNWTFRRDFIR